MDVERVVEVAGKKWQLPLDVKDETAAKPSRPKPLELEGFFLK